MQFKKERGKWFNYFLSYPFIYGMIFPLVFLDFSLEIYRRICFPLYGIKQPKRSQYIKIDRQKLAYLNMFEKFNCMYCGYANGVASFAVKIAGDTERYWCGIKHAERKGFKRQLHQKNFLPYGDEDAFNNFLNK